MKNLLFITFDVKRDEYPSMSYSIAALIAALKNENIHIAHHSVDIQHALEEKGHRSSVTDEIRSKLKSSIEYFNKFDFIAIGVNSWTFDYCICLTELLSDFKGKTILGGYEITSTPESVLIESFPKADYFIKGYAEKALRDIIVHNGILEEKVISGQVQLNDLASPYLSNVLGLNTRKIYWETKRGCEYKCGFCEWGNATKNTIPIDNERLFKEIELFRNSSIDEVNILDGTFNTGPNYITILKKLLEIPTLHITCQARFEKCVDQEGSQEFIRLCAENRDRLHLEFGLQTIHDNEMKTIGRTNNIDRIRKVMAILKENNIDYETSIIYAIPGQTPTSFIETIEFLIENGCKTIRAFPLQIPKNSQIEERRNEYCITERKDKYNVRSVNSTSSFFKEQREDMDRIASRLNSGQFNIENSFIQSFDHFDKVPGCNYLRKISSINESEISSQIIEMIKEDFIRPTLNNIEAEDFTQGNYLRIMNTHFKNDQETLEIISAIISGDLVFELRKPTVKLADIRPGFENLKIDTFNPNLVPKKYKCNLLISKSGNFYVTRDIVVNQK